MARGQNLKIEQVALRELSLPEQNPRKHSAENIAAIKESLRTFGQPEPILVRKADKTIIHGCGRYAAMRELKWPFCRVVFLEVSEIEADALAVTLNRTAELASWNMPELSDILDRLQSEGVSLSGLGWTDGQLDGLIADLIPPELPSEPASSTLTAARPRIGQSIPMVSQGVQGPISDDSERPTMGRPISVTKEQREIFDQALQRMKQRHADDGPEISQGRCVEFLAADYLAGP